MRENSIPGCSFRGMLKCLLAQTCHRQTQLSDIKPISMCRSCKLQNFLVLISKKISIRCQIQWYFDGLLSCCSRWHGTANFLTPKTSKIFTQNKKLVADKKKTKTREFQLIRVFKETYCEYGVLQQYFFLLKLRKCLF